MPTLKRPEPDFGDLIVWGCMGTACAAAAYPLLAMLLEPLLKGSLSTFLAEISGALGTVAMGVVLGGLMATIVAGFTSGWLSLLVNLFRLSIGWKVSPIVLATFIGGLTGFLCGMAFTDWYRAEWQNYAVGPGLATIVGQIGAAYGAARMSGLRTPPQRVFVGSFGIRQLMILTAWGAGLLALAKVTGALTAFNAALVAGWLVLQTVTLCGVVWLAVPPQRTISRRG